MRSATRPAGDGEAAVSPVIGVVLLIAITVVLFATISAVFLGYSATTDTPQAEFDFEYDGGKVRVLHAGGDSIDGDQLIVSVAGGAEKRWSSKSPVAEKGKSLEISASSGDTVRLIYVADTGSSTTTLATYQVP